MAPPRVRGDEVRESKRCLALLRTVALEVVLQFHFLESQSLASTWHRQTVIWESITQFVCMVDVSSKCCAVPCNRDVLALHVD